MCACGGGCDYDCGCGGRAVAVAVTVTGTVALTVTVTATARAVSKYTLIRECAGTGRTFSLCGRRSMSTVRWRRWWSILKTTDIDESPWWKGFRSRLDDSRLILSAIKGRRSGSRAVRALLTDQIDYSSLGTGRSTCL